MSNKVIRNKRGDTFVVVDDYRERVKREMALRSPDASRDYDTLKERFAARLAAEASLGQKGERQLDEKTIERVYDEFLRDDIEPLARPELEEMAQEIYHEARAGYRGGERTERGAIAAIAETFGRAIEQRTTQERLTETLLEDVYKKTHRAFLEQGAYHLIPELQTIYLGALVKLRTRGHVTDSALLEAERAERPKVTKPKKEDKKEERVSEKQGSSLDQAQRLLAARDKLNSYQQRVQEYKPRVAVSLLRVDDERRKGIADLFEGIQGRSTFAPLYFNQAEHELQKMNNAGAQSILLLFENMVHTLGRDLELLNSFLPRVGAAEGARQPEHAEPQTLPQDIMKELLPLRRTLLARWNPLFGRLKSQKAHIDAMMSLGAVETKEAATLINQRVREMLSHIQTIKMNEDTILSNIVEGVSISQDDLTRYRDLLTHIETIIQDVNNNADILGL